MEKLMSLTDRLKEIRARLDAARPAPWFHDDSNIMSAADADEKVVHAVKVVYWHPENEGYIADQSPQGDANAELIAHSPADISLLLSVVEIYREALEDIQDHCPVERYRDIAREALASAEQLVERGEK